MQNSKRSSFAGDWQKAGLEFQQICQDLQAALQAGHSSDSKLVQDVIKRHFVWIGQFWIPVKESYCGLGMGYTQPEWQGTFAQYDQRLPQFLADGMNYFAENNL